jgi:hypothetical protein
MSDFVLTLKIDKIGDREALNALNDLDKKGRQIIEGVSGATGRAMGDIAVAYERGSKVIRNQLDTIAQGHYDNIKAMESEQKATERALSSAAEATDHLGLRNEHAMAGAARGLEMLGRTGSLTGRSLDAVVGQVSQMAFAFGPGGQLVAAIGISTAAIVEMFMRTSREAKKAADEAIKEFDRIAHMDVKGQGEAASILYGGDPNSATPYQQASLAELKRLRAAALKDQKDGTSSFTGAYGITTKSLSDDAKKAADSLKDLNKEIERRNDLLSSINGPAGSLARAGAKQAADDLPGFVTDQLAAQATADKAATKAAQKAHDAAIKAFARGVEERQKASEAAVATEVAKITDANDPNVSLNENLARALNRKIGTASGSAQKGLLDGLIPSKEDSKEFMLGLERSISDAIKNDPFIAFQKAIKDLAKRMQDELQRTLGDGLAAGFEAAFSGKGIGNAFKSLAATVLSGLGGFLEQLGGAMLLTGVWMTLFAESIKKLNGPGAIAAGVGLIAAGAALKALAGRFGGGQSAGSGGGGGYSGSGAGLSQIIDRGTINPNSYTQTDARTIPNKPTIHASFNVIGPDDPNAVRSIDEILRRIDQRGSLAGR